MSAQGNLVLDMPACMKQEPESEHSAAEAAIGLFTHQVHIEEAELPELAVYVKVEPWEPGVSETESQAGLYTDKAQGGIVLGPECTQRSGVTYVLHAAPDQAPRDYGARLGRCVIAKSHCEAPDTSGTFHGRENVPPQIVSTKLQDTTNITYVCDTCGKNFHQKRYLIQHIKLHLSKNHDYLCTKSYSCEICKQRSKGLSNKRKMVVKQFSCEMCQKKFTRSDHLKVHGRTHTGAKPYTCKICFTQFAHQKTLKTHTQIHTGVKPYSCEICKQKFTQLGNLKRHTLVHTGEKPFCCDVCTKQFIGLSDLKRHKRIHTGDKPYSCKICKKEFAVSSHLTRHKQIHTREKLFLCDTCKMPFSCKSHLDAHKRTHLSKKCSSVRSAGYKENGRAD